MIKIVRGNKFRLLIPLEITTTEGGESKTEAYTPTEALRVSVKRGGTAYDIPYTVQGNVVVVDVAADRLGNGVYAVEITDTDVRAMRREQFCVVESTDDADISQPTDFEVQTAQLEAQTFVGGMTESEVKRIIDEHLGITENDVLLTTKG